MSRFQSYAEYQEYLTEEKRKHDDMMEKGRKEYEEWCTSMSQKTKKEKEEHNNEELKKIYEYLVVEENCVDN